MELYTKIVWKSENEFETAAVTIRRHSKQEFVAFKLE